MNNNIEDKNNLPLDDFEISISFNKKVNDLIIGEESSSGARYDCKSIFDIKNAINSYIDNYIEIEKIQRKEREER